MSARPQRPSKQISEHRPQASGLMPQASVSSGAQPSGPLGLSPGASLCVLFDGDCPMCRRTVQRLRAIDWLHRLEFANAMDTEVRDRIAPGLTEAAVMIQMYVVDAAGNRYAGYAAVLRIARVVPLMWPLALVGGLPGIRHAGHAVYRTVAANRVRRGRCTDEVCTPG